MGTQFRWDLKTVVLSSVYPAHQRASTAAGHLSALLPMHPLVNPSWISKENCRGGPLRPSARGAGRGFPAANVRDSRPPTGTVSALLLAKVGVCRLRKLSLLNVHDSLQMTGTGRRGDRSLQAHTTVETGRDGMEWDGMGWDPYMRAEPSGSPGAHGDPPSRFERKSPSWGSNPARS